MKELIVIVGFLVAAMPSPAAFQIDSSKRMNQTVTECLTGYNIDPAVLDINTEDVHLMMDELSGEQRGCVTACVYKGFDWLKDDGSLDIDALTMDEDPEDTAEFIKDIVDCRNKVGTEACKFFHCLDTKGT
ncbi:uncharacterized protein LOC100680165 [Nasonia vitripennis]|uniref:Putative odorant binding protein 20 n=1 Tax=Nasonia vitripennis TaxID=7425 RepID=G8B1M5_NASVI|nr:uncharacterized protein LOC100680165 [Nasonia vitripennis]CCD17789.1 putative odorant binding protein 20 [Nasonia vitripennis]